MTQAQLSTAIAQAVAKAIGRGDLNKRKARGKTKKAKGRTTLTEAEKAVYAAQNDAACVAAFTKAGYPDVQPRINVLTYGKVKEDGSKTGWLSKGRRVIKGQKAVRVGPFALFHVSQTEEIPLADQAPANEAAA